VGNIYRTFRRSAEYRNPNAERPKVIQSSVYRLPRRESATITNLRGAAQPVTAGEVRQSWLEAYLEVRAETERRAAKLSPEDQVIQSMADASPTKWHRAHTTWFLEQFLLVPFLPDYQIFDPDFAFLFNSYYVAAGPRHARPERGMVTRPNAARVAAYRAHVDAGVERLLSSVEEKKLAEVLRIVEIGMHHEQQHQELMLTDILHAFAQNPVAPGYDRDWTPPCAQDSSNEFVRVPSGIRTIGYEDDGYYFDNEGPAHQVLLQPVRISRNLVTNAQWLEFMADGGYTTPSLWLSDGWTTVCNEGWTAPGYWREADGAWHALTLAGLVPIDLQAPVCHVSYYEADAFARWTGKDLPTEAEWEVAAKAGLLADAFGIVWQWTRSAYAAYPGFRAAEGALGEYNGKFMINQMVLRGSSQATPVGHSRATYRNFFYPPARWQFTGLRLAEY
jgi:ergothioneine biosynthesis protein EgtB